MKNFLFCVFLALVLIVPNACSVKPKDPKQVWNEQEKARITALENLLHNDDQGKYADSAAVLLIEYQNYYNKNVTDSLSAHYLLEAAKLAEGIGKYQKAIDLLFNYHEAFKWAPQRDFVVFRIAFIYDEHLKNKAQAEHFYNQVIQLYPTSVWAEQAKAALSILNMTDEQLLDYLKAQNPGTAQQ